MAAADSFFAPARHFRIGSGQLQTPRHWQVRVPTSQRGCLFRDPVAQLQNGVVGIHLQPASHEAHLVTRLESRFANPAVLDRHNQRTLGFTFGRLEVTTLQIAAVRSPRAVRQSADSALMDMAQRPVVDGFRVEVVPRAWRVLAMTRT